MTCLSCSSLHITPSKKIQALDFDRVDKDERVRFWYADTINSPELTTLRSHYRLDCVYHAGGGELDRVLRLLDWTHNRWKHSGSNTPSESKTLVILQEAAGGKRFRCVEYGLVLKSVLAACGFNARTLGLKTKDVAVTRVGAGHVASEVWSNEYQKWVMLDAQFNLLAIKNNEPLNAVELQNAIYFNEDFSLIDARGEVSKKRRAHYLRFISHYLFFFDTKFDQREVTYKELMKIDSKAVLMLVPMGATAPKYFQRNVAMDYLRYTHSIREFYQKP